MHQTQVMHDVLLNSLETQLIFQQLTAIAATIFANNVGIHMIKRSCLIGSMIEIMMLDTHDDITIDDQVRIVSRTR